LGSSMVEGDGVGASRINSPLDGCGPDRLSCESEFAN
jgi:hypothetical protein